MSAQILDGKRIADEALQAMKQEVEARVAAGKSRPGLAVILVGDNPASQSYVRNKRRAAEIVGIQTFDYNLELASEDELLALIDELNANPAVHGILVQLPLPGIPDAARLIERIDPNKDVDMSPPSCRTMVMCFLIMRIIGLVNSGLCLTAQSFREMR